MKFLILIPLAVLTLACTPLREATVAVDEAVVGQVNEKPVAGARLVCFEGPICKEIEVRRIQVEESGPVTVVLRNRTGNALALQLSLEVVEPDGRRAEKTRFYDLAMAPRQEGVLDVHGVGRSVKPDRELVLVVRSRRAL